MMGRHFLREFEAYRALLACLDVRGRSVLEIGAGHGEITTLLLDAGAQVLAYESDTSLVPLPGLKDVIQYRDITREDLSFLNRSWVVVSNSRHGLLPWCLDLIDRYKIETAVLMCSKDRKPHLEKSSFHAAFTLCGSAFDPPLGGLHTVMVREAQPLMY